MATVSEQIQEIYIGLLGRAADKSGLDYWTAEINAGTLTIEQLRANIVNEQPEYAAGLGSMTRAQTVNELYNRLFERNAEADGLEYWVNGGGAAVNVDQLVLALSAGASASDKLVLDNKTDAAEYYTANITTYTADSAKAAVDSVDGTAASVDASKASTDGNSQSAGQTFTLTTGIDTLTGTASNDTFVGAFDGAATATTNLGDTIDGGAGEDTVTITTNQAANNVIPTLTNVENLHIINAGVANESRDASAIAGLTSLEIDGGSTIAAADTLTFTVGTGQSLILDSVTDGNAAADAGNDGAANIASAAGVTALNVTLDGVGAQTGLTTVNDLDLDVTGTGAATLNVTATGTNNVSLANTGAALKTLNVDGAGSLTVQGTTATTITTLNAAANTGGVTVDLSASAGANQTVSGGTGNDTLTVDLAQNITLDAGAGNDVVTLANPTAVNLSSTTGAADSIKGGEGTDVLAVSAAGAVALAGDTAADRAVVTGFEALRTTSDLNASTFDISKLGVNTLQIAAATTTAAATVSGFTSGATVEYRANADSTGANGQVNVGITNATAANTPDDLLNINLNANLTAQANAAAAIEFTAGVAGINKLAVTTADSSNADGATNNDDGYILTLANDNNVSLITASGSSELAFASTASTAALATFNAADLAGDLILDLSTNGLTQGVTVTGGSNTNTITGTGFADVISGGAKADTITSGNGADSLTGGAGADTFVFAAGSTGGAPSASNVEKISDFASASDIIDHAANVSFVTNATAAAGTAALSAEGFATFHADDDTLAEMITAAEAGINAGGAAAAGQTALFVNGGNTYVFISDGTDGVDANDVLIELTGVTGLTDTTVNGGNLTIA